LFYSDQVAGGSLKGLDPENMVGGQNIGCPVWPVFYVLQVPGEPGHCRARTWHPPWISRGVFPSKCPPVAPAEMSNTPHWYFGLWIIINEEDVVLTPKNPGEIFLAGFGLGIIWGWVSRYAATTLIVGFSGHSDITRFRPWPIIMTGIHLDRAKENRNIAQKIGNVGDFGPRSGISGPTSRRASACPNLNEWWAQPAHVRCPVAQLLIYTKSGGLPRLARELFQ